MNLILVSVFFKRVQKGTRSRKRKAHSVVQDAQLERGGGKNVKQTVRQEKGKDVSTSQNF